MVFHDDASTGAVVKETTAATLAGSCRLPDPTDQEELHAADQSRLHGTLREAAGIARDGPLTRIDGTYRRSKVACESPRFGFQGE